MNSPAITSSVVGGLKTGVSVIGSGADVLLLHGWGGSIQSVLPIGKKLAEAGFTAHMLDLPGFGQTKMPPTAWGVPEYTKWVLEYMDVAGLDKVFLFGHSFGGRISLVLAADYPERVLKLALSNPAGIKLPPSLKVRFLSIVRSVGMVVLSVPGLHSLRDKLRHSLRQRFASEDYLNAGALQETFKKVVSQDLLPYARRIKASTLLFWGDLDQETPLRMGQILEREMKDAGLIVFAGAGHFAYLDKQPQFMRAVLHFFSTPVTSQKSIAEGRTS